MDLKGVFERVFERTNKEAAIEIIKERRPDFPTPKKSTRKHELKDDFIQLKDVIREDEVEEFIEMAVMARAVGLPAYTYKLSNINFLYEDESQGSLEKIRNLNDFPFQNKYSLTVGEISDENNTVSLVIRLKEYAELWKTGTQNIESLSAVYKINLNIDKSNNVVTVYSGNHKVQEVLKDFFSLILNWPIQNYRIREIPSQLNDIKSASFTTALLLDFIFNRINERGIFSKIKEVKFDTKNKRHKKEGIRNITINGRNLLSSQLACEYITLGSSIISFKVDMTYNETDCSAQFSLKGNELDILKIVVTGQEDEDFKEEVVDILQDEYIKMCVQGILNMDETTKLLEQVYDRFINRDKLVNEVIQKSSLNIVDTISANLDRLNTDDEEILDMLAIIYKENKILLDSIGYSEISENLETIKSLSGYEDSEGFFDDDIEGNEEEEEEETEDYQESFE